jgi:polar amino acid transport system substrate-binding protein
MVPQPMESLRIGTVGVIALTVIACTIGSAPTPSPSTESAGVCIQSVALKNPPRLTMSTDDPASPPWFGGDPDYQFPMEPQSGSGWVGGEPYSMEGFEGGISYSLADALGYEYDQVDWVHNYAIEDALAPGDKPFDIHVAHVAISEARAQSVDFSDPYYSSYQAVVAIAPNPISEATLIADLKPYRLGALEGTSSADVINEVVKPDVAASTYADMAAAIAALTGGEIDGLVADINFALYLRDGWIYDRDHKIANAVVVGRFAPSTWTDSLAAVLEKGSALTPCVNAAVAQIKAENFINEYVSEYIDADHGVPDLR